MRYPANVLLDMSAEDMMHVMREIQPEKRWGLFTPEETGEAYTIFFMHEDVCITDPTVSHCGRFDMDPVKDYGLTEEAAMTMLIISSILQERFSDGH